MSRPSIVRASKRPVQSQVNKQSVAKLEALLSDQQTRIQERENETFLEQRNSEYCRYKDQAYPRTFENKQFFSPHLRRSTQLPNDPVRREYVLVLNNGLVVRQSHKSRTPPGTKSSDLFMSAAAKDRLRELTAQGWTVCGHNSDMVELERLYNPRTKARNATWNAAKKYAIGAITLTVVIYVGQWFMD